ncbi:MAG: hypothetical protein IMZ66_05765 [Planctomycetes bacterium]|nr:hypothetical protein [Planctomycetota bacterium]
MADPPEGTLAPESLRHLRHNYVVHAVEGGLFMGGLWFVSATTLMPTVVQSLGGPDWLVALTPILMLVGMLLPPVFMAHRIERLERYMPMLLVTSAIQRLPFLVAGLVLLLAAGSNPWLALVAVAAAPLVSGAAGGISLTAWQQLLLGTVPPARRSSLFAIRYTLSGVVGLAAGWAVRVVLEAWPGPPGYGVLHLCTFGFLVAGYAAFAMVREPRLRPPADARPLGLAANLRGIPRLIVSAPSVRQYMLARSFMSGVFIVTPFLAIHARRVLGETESYLGLLLIVQTLGAMLGNAVGGVLGDRAGGKAVLLASQVSFIALAGWSLVAATALEFHAIFLLFGFAFNTMNIGTMTVSLEICPARQRSTCLASISFVCLASTLVAMGTSALVWTGPERFGALAALTAASVAASLVLTVPLRDPRTAAPAA